MRGWFPQRAVVALAVILLIGLGVVSPGPAQTRRVIHVALNSYKFEPSNFFVNEGDTVVLQLENVDKETGHAFDSQYLSKADFTVTGKYKQGVARDGAKYVFVDSGDRAEITFVAKDKGQYGFYCGVDSHAAKGQTGAFVIWPAGYHLATRTP